MRHTARQIRPGRLSGLSRGFGGAFDLAPTFDPGGAPISTSVQTSELAVTGTYAARAPTLISNAAQVVVPGTTTQPSVRYSDGTVITAEDRNSQQLPAGWSPDPRTWGSPLDAINGAARVASNQVESAQNANLTPSETGAPTVENGAVDGTWVVGPDATATLVESAPRIGNGNMKWWHWGLLGAAVFASGYALSRAFR